MFALLIGITEYPGTVVDDPDSMLDELDESGAVIIDSCFSGGMYASGYTLFPPHKNGGFNTGSRADFSTITFYI